jgi:cytoskeletal protein CcmA (bactofilin family)
VDGAQTPHPAHFTESVVALWKDPAPRKDVLAALPFDGGPRPAELPPDLVTTRESPRYATARDVVESVIGSDLAIEGKILGRGHVRIAGRFTGDVAVDGNLTIDAGARLVGSVRATMVALAGELEGNIVDAARVELQPSAVLVGDLRAGTLTVAAGSRMRGHVEFGWADEAPHPATNGSAPREADALP